MSNLDLHRRDVRLRRGGIAGGRKRAFTGSLNRTRGDGPERDDLEPDDMVPAAERQRDDDSESRWVAYLYVDGRISVEHLRGRPIGNLVRIAAICDTRREAEERAKEWRE